MTERFSKNMIEENKEVDSDGSVTWEEFFGTIFHSQFPFLTHAFTVGFGKSEGKSLKMRFVLTSELCERRGKKSRLERRPIGDAADPRRGSSKSSGFFPKARRSGHVCGYVRTTTGHVWVWRVWRHTPISEKLVLHICQSGDVSHMSVCEGKFFDIPSRVE